MPSTTYNKNKKLGSSEESYNDFHYNGKEFGKGVHYTCLDYVPVSRFTPLSGTNWWRVDAILGKPVVNEERQRIDISVECLRCGDASQKQTKILRIEVVSYDRNLFRVRFNPYAKTFCDYDDNENNYGPITRAQMDWIQQQNTARPNIKFVKNGIEITLKDVVMTFDERCEMSVRCRHTGKILHKDGSVTPPGMNETNQPKGIIFVDEQYGSAVAAIKTLSRDKNNTIPNFYGCGECQNYYNTHDDKQNHSSSLNHSRQAVTFFNYDNYGLNQDELRPTNERPVETGAEQEFIPQYVTAPFFVEYPNDCSYAYGLLLDNTSQSYINLGCPEFTGAIDPEKTQNLKNVYFFGAQYPELDYYLIFPSPGKADCGLIAAVIDNYTILTGREHELGTALNIRGAMPPKYIFGAFQGVYGFSGLTKGDWPVQSVVDGYKKSNIPLEGLAIDVDVQNEFEVFTTSGDFWESGKVGNGDSVFEWAHKQDLVCQTNITNFIRSDRKNYPVYDIMEKKGLETKCSKYVNFGDSSTSTEPTSYPAILPYTGTPAVFPNFSLPETQSWWGRNYWDEKQVPNSLLKTGLDFVWQDMTVPAMSPHYLGNKLVDWNNYDPNTWDSVLTSGRYNWKTYHGQQLYGDPRHPGKSLPYIGLRNLHAYMECKATFEHGLTVPGHCPSYYNRSYIISRGGYIGLAHYGGFWTGDNDSSWKCMQIRMPKILNMGICGFPIVGSDIGGFAPSDSETYNHVQEHLLVRWVQASSLLPWFRDHYVRKNSQHDGKDFQELFKFEWTYNGRKYSDIMNDFVKMRVRFHHVLYSSMYKFCQTGHPLVQPTCLYEGGSSDINVMRGYTSSQDSQYFVGESTILVSAAMEDENCGALVDRRARNYPATIVGHPVWLPANAKWFPYDARYDGPCDPGDNFRFTQGSFGFYQGDGSAPRFTVPLENLPVFIRAGAILPTRITQDGTVKNIQQLDKDSEPYVFDIWPGAEYSYQCYFDDGGKTRNAELKGEYSLLTISQKLTDDNWQISFSTNYMKYKLHPYIYIRFRAAVSGSVSDNKKRFYSPCKTLADIFANKGPGWFYDSDKKEEWVKVPTDILDGLVITKEKSYTIHEMAVPSV